MGKIDFIVTLIWHLNFTQRVEHDLAIVKWKYLCHISKQEMSKSQWFLASKCEGGLPRLWSSGCYHPPVATTPKMLLPLPLQDEMAVSNAHFSNLVQCPATSTFAEEQGECGKQPSATPWGELGREFGPRRLRCMWKEWIQSARRLASSHT